MAKDEGKATGKGGAKDAKPADDGAKMQAEMDELAKRRAQARGEGDPLAADGNGKSVEDRAAGGEEVEEEEDGQFAFVSAEEKGKRITLGTLIKRGTPVEYRISMGAKSNILRGQLLDPEDTNHLLLVRGVVGGVNTEFTRDEHENIVKATVYVAIKPKTVVNAKTEQAAVMLHGEPPSVAEG